METHTLHIVTATKQVKNRIVLVSILFITAIIIIGVSAFVFHNAWIPFVAFAIFAIIARASSKKQDKIVRIGTMALMEKKIELKNDKLNLTRDIELNTLSKVHIREGVKVDAEKYINSQSLIVDLTLHSGEVVSVQVEVENLDEDTCDLMEGYLKQHNIPCTRKI